MIDLKSARKIAELRAQTRLAERESAELLLAAAAHAKQTAIAQFKQHFIKGGFNIEDEPDGYAATYEGMRFSLRVDDEAAIGTFCDFTLDPPSGLGEAKVLVQMLRKGGANSVKHINAGVSSPVGDAERELEDARAILAGDPAEFHFVVADKKPATLAGNQLIRSSRPNFSTFGDFLVNAYPQEVPE
jgi:hypothetical protein